MQFFSFTKNKPFKIRHRTKERTACQYHMHIGGKMLNLQFTCVFGRVFPPNICINLASMWSGFWEKVLQSYNLSSSFTDCSCYARTRNKCWMMLFFSSSEIFATLQSAIHLKSDISQHHRVLETWEISLIIQDIAAKHLCPFGKKNLAIQMQYVSQTRFK